MNVKELIEELSKIDNPKRRIYIWSYESNGVQEIEILHLDEDGDIVVFPVEI